MVGVAAKGSEAAETGLGGGYASTPERMAVCRVRENVGRLRTGVSCPVGWLCTS